jgi:hypothetical protein
MGMTILAMMAQRRVAVSAMSRVPIKRVMKAWLH